MPYLNNSHNQNPIITVVSDGRHSRSCRLRIPTVYNLDYNIEERANQINTKAMRLT